MAYFKGILSTDLSRPGYSEELLCFHSFFKSVQKPKLKTNGCPIFEASETKFVSPKRFEMFRLHCFFRQESQQQTSSILCIISHRRHHHHHYQSKLKSTSESLFVFQENIVL